ncbi:DNA-entry nuclease [Lactobacillus delbrueckii subsp. jakobsenii ZN7a-9 = DSM 26046]|uniref:DNA/RNA non-specific endonuclease n=1 Tax=Lactobacillus delbrueckii TaxID=1584 RepID=UPI00033061DC|nr:DNA-entry nuclease [Lactobacillus delbrueckii subsp. jakobsenii ZN7a-9 = DSM 26046]EOD03413.1 DNA-entry nuclease [Lactobacillus delbrueckii subsp. jakobsenii ZN7a-9 = DSM 26046]TDG65235.1 hypothetical protein C5L19_000983 [Lactobacillus delbrueckii subsp. jakobsenii]
MNKKFAKVTSVITVAFAMLTFGGNVNAATNLANVNYSGKAVFTVDNNKPNFSKKDLSKKRGSWQKCSNLDGYNRARVANALLNKKLMPTQPREALYWDPTGWHNKRIASGWLYNRSHLIGYQLTGQNNNPKNLITGTRQLNDPGMLKYENIVANYLRSSKSHYVRYRVNPVFKGTELLARGVEMEAQSVGSNAVRYHVYVFNVQPGVKLNYKDGTSVVSGTVRKAKKAYVAKKKTVKKVVKKKSYSTSKKKIKTSTTGRIVGNRRSKIYHVPGQAGYRMSSANAVYFRTEAQAKAAGYRRALR